MKYTYIYRICVICILLVLTVLVYSWIFPRTPIIYEYEYFDDTSESIPKCIWTYWSDVDIPNLIEKFIDTWRRTNPDWKIVVLNDDNLAQYVPEVDMSRYTFVDSLQRKSDIIRCLILSKYGGVWSDASIIMYQSLDRVLDIQRITNCEFIGYYLRRFTSNMDYPVIESWFFACVPNCKFMAMWRDTFLSIQHFTDVNEWLNNMLHERHVDIQNIDAPNYLAIHVAAQYVLQKLMTIDEIKKSMHLMEAESGPYKYLVEKGWNSYDGVTHLCNNNFYHTLFSKLRGCERAVVEKDTSLETCIFTH